jgi:hypothetical protein
METLMTTHVTMRLTFAPGDFVPATEWSITALTLHIRAVGAGTWATRVTDVRGVQRKADGGWRASPRAPGFSLRRTDIPAPIRQEIAAAYLAGRRDLPATLQEAFVD